MCNLARSHPLKVQRGSSGMAGWWADGRGIGSTLRNDKIFAIQIPVLLRLFFTMSQRHNRNPETDPLYGCF